MKILYKEYAILKLQRLFGFKRFRMNIGTVATKDNILAIGREYQYKEGSHLERVRIEDVCFRNYYIEVKINFLEQDNRIITCSHKFVDCGYSGMWRLWDKDKFDIEEWRKEMEGIDYSHLDNLPVIEI